MPQSRQAGQVAFLLPVPTHKACLSHDYMSYSVISNMRSDKGDAWFHSLRSKQNKNLTQLGNGPRAGTICWPARQTAPSSFSGWCWRPVSVGGCGLVGGQGAVATTTHGEAVSAVSEAGVGVGVVILGQVGHTRLREVVNPNLGTTEVQW
jgi:hypothetical protein